jgi:hypothetical protein
LCVAGGSLVTVAAIYSVLWIATGYDPIGSLSHAMDLTRGYVSASSPALFPALNLFVFALGAGFVAIPIAVVHAGRFADRRDTRDLPLTLIGIATILVINLTGLFAGETDRDWLFLLPLICVPAAIELARLSWRWRLLVFAMQGWILICLRAKLSFIEP